MAKIIMTVSNVVICDKGEQREASIQALCNGCEINCTGRGATDLAALQGAIKTALSQVPEDESAIQVSCYYLERMLRERVERIHDRTLEAAGIQSNRAPNLAY